MHCRHALSLSTVGRHRRHALSSGIVNMDRLQGLSLLPSPCIVAEEQAISLATMAIFHDIAPFSRIVAEVLGILSATTYHLAHGTLQLKDQSHTTTSASTGFAPHGLWEGQTAQQRHTYHIDTEELTDLSCLPRHAGQTNILLTIKQLRVTGKTTSP